MTTLSQVTGRQAEPHASIPGSVPIDRLEQTARVQEAHFWFRAFRRRLASTLDAILGPRRDVRILDCGCGAGANLRLLSRYGPVFGLDLSSIGLTLARSAGRPLVRADITRIPFADSSFDMVTSFDVFQQLPDDDVALREMARVLRPGGLAVLSTTALEALKGDHSEVWDEVRRYTPARARAFALRAELTPVRAEFLFASLVPIIWCVRRWQRWRRHGNGVAASDLEMPATPVNIVLTYGLLLEGALARLMPMPFGSSILMVARKTRGG